MFKRAKIGLALGGGGARGIAHIGVLKVLEEYKIPIDMISGTSMGAIIGALYASEPNAKKLEKETISHNWKDLFDYGISRSGIIKGDRIEEYLEKKLDNVKFKDLKIPLYISTFDLKKKREVVFSRGDVARAVRASISIPGIFIPVRNQGEILVDGGVTDIVPIEILRNAGADIILAVNVDKIKQNKTVYGQKAMPKSSAGDLPNIFKIIARSSQMISGKASQLELEKERADFVISPKLEKIETLDFAKVRKTIKIGEIEARRSIEEIRTLAKPNIFKDFLNQLDSEIKSKKGFFKKLEKDLSSKERFVGELKKELHIKKSKKAVIN